MNVAPLNLERSGFLTQAILEAHRVQLFPPDGEVGKFDGASVDLRLGDECMVTSEKVPMHLTSDGPYLVIPPGAFAILTTLEEVAVPADLLGLITMKRRFKDLGLINVSGFHVDPGWSGRLTYSVYNAGPNDISVRRGERVFTIFLATLVSATTEYEGEHRDQTGLSSSQVQALTSSPVTISHLEKRLDALQARVSVAAAVAIGVAVPVALLAFQELFG